MFLVLFVMIRNLQRSNSVSIAGVCFIISSILHNDSLTDVSFDHQPPECVCDTAWQRQGLAVPPVEVQYQGWQAVLSVLRSAVRRVFLRLSSETAVPHVILCCKYTTHLLFSSATPCLLCSMPPPPVPSSVAAACTCNICSCRCFSV